MDKAAGMYWSIPASVAAQQQYDDCLWVNLNGCKQPSWCSVSAFKSINEVDLSDFPSALSSPFSRPDMVVFEGFYNFQHVKMAKELRYRGIPYIVIPRGSLTTQAFHNHNFLNYFKKKIACWFLFRPYTRKASAIQFLTAQEYIDSGNSWCRNHFILPNGINMPESFKVGFSPDGIKGVYIGRPSMLHKGLDILAEACELVQDDMRKAQFTIDCHMPKKEDYDAIVDMVEGKGISDIMRVKDGVFGDEKKQTLMSADVFILTSRFEGHPMALIEALSYGLPVAVTEGSNMRKEIAKSDAGWACDTSVNGVVAMLKAIIAEHSTFVKKGTNARNLAANYRWDNLAKAFHEEIMQLL
jgi:glycosyltransferase involved in cell wall biosynthesis